MERRNFLHSASFAVFGAANAATLTTDANASETSTSRITVPNYTFDINNFARDLNSIAPFSNEFDVTVDPFALVSEVRPALGDSTTVSAANNLPKILQPIDTGASQLLTAEQKAVLEYNPFDVEYLLGSLSDYVKALLDLREKGQQLELLSIFARLEIYLEEMAIKGLKKISAFSGAEDRNVVGHMYLPIVQGTAVVSTNSDAIDEKYWKVRQKNDDDLLDQRYLVNEQKRGLLTVQSSGTNYDQRFLLIKSKFDTYLTDAYKRARAVHFGLKEIYNIDTVLPELQDTGYLDKLSNWAFEASQKLEKTLLKTRQVNVPIALSYVGDVALQQGIFSPADFKAATQLGTFEFKFGPEYLKKLGLDLKNPRLKGVQVLIWSELANKPLDYVSVHLQLPLQAINSDSATMYSSQTTIEMPLVTYPQGPIELVPKREIQNENLFGKWVISMEKQTVAGHPILSDDIMKNVFIVASISYQTS